MLMKKEGQSSSILEALPSPHIVAGLLKTKQYNELDDLLDQVQSLIRQSEHHPLIDDILLAARQICIACSILQDEANWYRWAADEAERREEELKSTLQTISDVMGGNELVKIHQQTTVVTVPNGLKPALSENHTANGGRGSNFWQRFQSLLRPELRFPSYSTEASIVAPTLAETKPNGVADPSPIKAAPEPEANRPDESVEPTPNTPVSGQGAASPAPKLAENKTEPSIVVYGLGAFQVYLNGQLVEDWPNRKGKSIFKYLLLQRTRPVAKEVLMECFWPDSDPNAARNNLNVAIYGLRRALRKVAPTVSHILFQDDCYLLNPDLTIWLDFESFMEHDKKGQQLENSGDLTQAAREYSAAELLYQGQLFEEDRYEDWPLSHRQALQAAYLGILDRLSLHYLETENFSACVALCTKMLAVDSCREEAHRRLMRCYSRQGQHYLALRQYQVCVESHKKELETLPSPETVELYEKIRSNQQL